MKYCTLSIRLSQCLMSGQSTAMVNKAVAPTITASLDADGEHRECAVCHAIQPYALITPGIAMAVTHACALATKARMLRPLYAVRSSAGLPLKESSPLCAITHIHSTVSAIVFG